MTRPTQETLTWCNSATATLYNVSYAPTTVPFALYTDRLIYAAKHRVYDGWTDAYAYIGAQVISMATATTWVGWGGAYYDDLCSGNQTSVPAAQVTVSNARPAYVPSAYEIAETKANELLTSILDPTQRASFEKERTFEILTRRNGEPRRYRVRYGVAGNIYLLDDTGKEIERFCIHADQGYPTGDHLVSQKLLLEADEEQFLRIANRSVRMQGIWVPVERVA